MISLPEEGAAPVPIPHFPSLHQAFIFRASEFVSFEKIAQVLGASVEDVRADAAEMGIDHAEESRVWLEKGYITIIRALWHLLPYEQLLTLLETDADTLAILLREEDFLDIKLGKKPRCAPVRRQELTEEEHVRTREIAKALKEAQVSVVK